MTCQRCGSERILTAMGKCSDCGNFWMNNLEIHKQGYVPVDLNIGGGDYLEFKVCMDCGQLQGTFPVSDEVIEESLA